MENISEHISWAEATVSAAATRKGIKNIPPASIIKIMKVTAGAVFEPLRNHFGPVAVISFFRSPEVNKLVGGAKESQHMKGEAIDVVHTSGFTNADIFNFFKNGNIDYDQIISEFPTKGEPAWVHVSFTTKRKNRRQALMAKKVNGKTVYTILW